MQTTPQPPLVMTLPGWLGSGPLHWQSRWEQLYGDVRVEQHDWQQPLRGDWITRLEDVVQNQLKAQPTRPIVFAAHSLGCHLVAAWAALSPNARRVSAALLVAPPAAENVEIMPQMHSWTQPVLNTLPFKTTLLASSRDPFCKLDAAQTIAEHWGSHFVNVGAWGHINAESGLGDWPAGREMLLALMPKTV